MFFSGGCRLQSAHHHANMSAARWQVPRQWKTGRCCGPRSESSNLQKGSESIEWFIKDLAISLSYDLAPPPPPLPSSSSLSYSVVLCVSRRAFRLLNDLQRTRHSRRRMVAPSPPPPPSSVSKLSLFLSLPVSRPSSLLTGEGWKRWGRNQTKWRRACLVLCKSFYALWEVCSL